MQRQLEHLCWTAHVDEESVVAHTTSLKGSDQLSVLSFISGG